MSKTRPVLDPHKLRFIKWGNHDLDSTAAAETTAQATLTVDDGDLDTENQFTEGEYVKITAADGTVGIFILTDSSETAVDTGTVLDASSDIGIGTPDSDLLAEATCIAFRGNLNIWKQYQVLNELKTAIMHADSPLNGKITASDDVGDVSGNLSITLAQETVGTAGNQTITTNMNPQLTVSGFSGGGSAERSWTTGRHPLTESDSGAIILIDQMCTANRTFTLPTAKKGLYFKFVWGVTETNTATRAIASASTAELIKGAILTFDQDTNNETRDITSNLFNGTNNDELQIDDGTFVGSYLELVSDGDHWYTAENKIIVTVATAVDENN